MNFIFWVAFLLSFFDVEVKFVVSDTTERLIGDVKHRVTRDNRGVLLETVKSPNDILKKLSIDSNKLMNKKRRNLLLDLNGTTIESEFLALHNEYRSSVALGDTSGHPSAKMMNYLFWDPALAAVAQSYADECVYEHNSERTDDLQSYSSMATFEFDEYSLSVGENIYAATYPESLEWLLYGITLWYDEYEYYDYDTQACSDVCGHYTQIVWDSTRYVGCGYSVCDPLSGVSWSSESIYLVCNYYPAGNSGRDPYTDGTQCTECDEDRTECDKGLCSGCMSEWFSYCSDHYSNCGSLSCPANCTLSDTSSICTGCRGSCETCTESMLTAPDTCDDGTGTSVLSPNNNGNNIESSNYIVYFIIGGCLLGGAFIAIIIILVSKNKNCVIIKPNQPTNSKNLQTTLHTNKIKKTNQTNLMSTKGTKTNQIQRV